MYPLEDGSDILGNLRKWTLGRDLRKFFGIFPVWWYLMSRINFRLCSQSAEAHIEECQASWPRGFYLKPLQGISEIQSLIGILNQTMPSLDCLAIGHPEERCRKKLLSEKRSWAFRRGNSDTLSEVTRKWIERPRCATRLRILNAIALLQAIALPRTRWPCHTLTEQRFLWAPFLKSSEPSHAIQYEGCENAYGCTPKRTR